MSAWFGANGIGDREGDHVNAIVGGIKSGSGSAAQGLKNAAQGGKMGVSGNKGARENVENAVTATATPRQMVVSLNGQGVRPARP